MTKNLKHVPLFESYIGAMNSPINPGDIAVCFYSEGAEFLSVFGREMMLKVKEQVDLYEMGVQKGVEKGYYDGLIIPEESFRMTVLKGDERYFLIDLLTQGDPTFRYISEAEKQKLMSQYPEESVVYYANGEKEEGSEGYNGELTMLELPKSPQFVIITPSTGGEAYYQDGAFEELSRQAKNMMNL